MRRFILVLAAALLAVAWLVTPAPCAQKLGRVIYVKTVGDQPSAPADVFEADLDSGSSKVIVSHKSLPKGFETRPEYASLSPSGRYLLVEECTGVITASGRQYGHTFAFVDGAEKSAKWIGDAYWLLDRKTGAWKRIGDAGNVDWIAWSPARDRLGMQESDGPLRLYDALTGKTQTLPKGEELSWSAKGDAFISIIRGEGKAPDSVGIRPIGGKRKTLFTWPGIRSICQSPNGVFAILDTSAFSVVDGKGKRLAHLKIPVEEDCFSADLDFSPNGSWLVVGTSYSYGEPHIGLREQTWLVDMKTMRARELASSGGMFGFSADDQVGGLSVEGWLSDDRSLMLTEYTMPGISYGSESQGQSSALRVYDVTGKTKSRKVFDSGPSCIALEWWGTR